MGRRQFGGVPVVLAVATVVVAGDAGARNNAFQTYEADCAATRTRRLDWHFVVVYFIGRSTL